MKRQVRVMNRKVEIEENLIDRFLSVVSPERARRRFTARVHMALLGGYLGASKSRRALKEWNPSAGDADADIMTDLPTLRARSRDMVRNEPLASGAILTKTTHVIGQGLKLNAQINRDILGMSDEEASAWEARTEMEWSLWWDSLAADAARKKKGPAMAALVYRQVLENGDSFVYLPRIDRNWTPYSLALQAIEADRVCNRDGTADTETLSGGIQRDQYGAPIEYYIMKTHPGALRFQKREWLTVPAYSTSTGLPNILHVMNATRPGQVRGVPDLAPVMEPLKQLGRYSEAELMAAVVSSLFTVFIETPAGEAKLDLEEMSGETNSSATDPDIKLSSGAVVGLAPGEKINMANPARPNTAFDPFTQAILQQIAVGLNLPYELLVKHFTASYSASRAALNEAWEYFMLERIWFADNFYRPLYEVWMYEGVSSGRIYAPGFFDDPLIRWAYLGSEWTGPARQPLDEGKEIAAATARVEGGLSTRTTEAARMTGTDFGRNVIQLGKEKKAMIAAGIWTDKAARPTPKEGGQEKDAKEKDDSREEKDNGEGGDNALA